MIDISNWIHTFPKITWRRLHANNNSKREEERESEKEQWSFINELIEIENPVSIHFYLTHSMLIPADVEVDSFYFFFILACARNSTVIVFKYIRYERKTERWIFTVSIWIYFQWNLNIFSFFSWCFFSTCRLTFRYVVYVRVCRILPLISPTFGSQMLLNRVKKSCLFGSVCKYALCSLNENTIYTTNRWRYTDNKNGLYNSVCQMNANANHVVILYSDGEIAKI